MNSPFSIQAAGCRDSFSIAGNRYRLNSSRQFRQQSNQVGVVTNDPLGNAVHAINLWDAVGSPDNDFVADGDMLLDIRSAACADVPVILVAGGSSPRSELEASGETLLEDLGGLGPLLQENRSQFRDKSS